MNVFVNTKLCFSLVRRKHTFTTVGSLRVDVDCWDAPSHFSQEAPICVHRGAVLKGLPSVPGGDSALPLVLQFYGHPSSFFWDDDEGVTHEIRQCTKRNAWCCPNAWSNGIMASPCSPSPCLISSKASRHHDDATRRPREK